jgi:hypothetical protein
LLQECAIFILSSHLFIADERDYNHKKSTTLKNKVLAASADSLTNKKKGQQ